MTNPPAGMPTIIPTLPYPDIESAVDWLTRAFGFCEDLEGRVEASGRLLHAEMTIGAGRIMLGSPGGHDVFPPTEAGHDPSQMLCVYVDDIDAHCERARAAGATICAELADKFFGDRVYEALDCDGHRWSFQQHTGRRFDFPGGD